jgi:hypothetical protein
VGDQTATAAILGVDSQGRTTYAVQQIQIDEGTELSLTGTTLSDSLGFPPFIV